MQQVTPLRAGGLVDTADGLVALEQQMSHGTTLHTGLRCGVLVGRDGRLSGDMAGLPEVMGRKTVEEAIQAAKGLPVDKQAVITPVLVTKENANQFL